MHDSIRKKTIVIAVCGKGGVGKTSISAAIIGLLSENSKTRVLAIDADPAVGLSTALGIEVGKTVDDVRNDLIGRLENSSEIDKKEMISRLDYELFSTISESNNTAFLAIGRPEKKGCYCQVNGILKDIIASLVENFDYVVIDGEAGIEQVNRRVMEKVSHLLLISDASAKGVYVAHTIKRLAGSAVCYEKAGLLLNRIRGEEEFKQVKIPSELDLIGWIPEDDHVRNCDIRGDSILKIMNCEAIRKTRECLISLGLPV